MQEYSFASIEKSTDLCCNVLVSLNFVSRKRSLLTVGTYNEIEQFIYTICYHPMWKAAYSSYTSEHPYTLNPPYSRIQNPISAMLEDMILEFPKNIRINGTT
jgi:hypothetical protein